MEASTPTAPPPIALGEGFGATLRRLANKYGLLVVLLALPVYYGIKDLTGPEHDLSRLANNLFSGLSNGSILALIAVGYTMVYGIIELINFAHGDVFTLSAFYSLFFEQLLRYWGLDLDTMAGRNVGGFLLALVVLLVLTMPAAGITGVLIERVAYRRLRNAPRLAPLITAIGVSFLLEGVMFATRGSSNYPTNRTDWVQGTAFSVASVDIRWTNVFVLVMA